MLICGAFSQSVIERLYSVIVDHTSRTEYFGPLARGSVFMHVETFWLGPILSEQGNIFVQNLIMHCRSNTVGNQTFHALHVSACWWLVRALLFEITPYV